MKQSKVMIKLLSVLLAFCFAFVSAVPGYVIMAKDNEYTDNYNSMTDAQKQAYLEQKVKELNQKLDELGNQTGETEEYINTIDEKISYLQQELALAKKTIENSQTQKKNLENQYENNEKEIAKLQQDIEQLAVKEKELQGEFDESYQQYSQRVRALYISGGTNVLELLLTSDDISVLFTRLEMIKRVSRADKNLLESLQDEGEKLLSTKASLEDKKSDLTTNQEKLIATKENLDETIKTLEAQQVSYSQKEKSYESEKEKADQLLIELHNETKTYSEFRNQDLEELNEINRQIEQAALEWQQKQEAAATTTTTTKKQTTTKKNNNSSNNTTTTKKQTTTQKTTTSSGKLSMTYPVPSQTKITTAYGSAGYAGHTGVDFACAADSRVVAAEDGEVIISTDLKNSDGTYRSYGRYIVIAHTKKNSAGNYVYTLYAHNNSRVVSKGDKVTKGQLIAYSGSTGNSSGPHCHFEVRTPTASYDDCVDPTPYLP